MNKGEQLTAGYKKTSVLEKDERGKRCFIEASLLKTEAVPEHIYSVSIPALNANECIVPDTLALSFKFNNSNTKSWFLNNLGRLLADRLSIKVQHRTKKRICIKFALCKYVANMKFAKLCNQCKGGNRRICTKTGKKALQISYLRHICTRQI